MKRINSLLIALFVCSLAVGQTRVVPAEPQAKPILLRGGTAHIGNGTVIQNSLVGFSNGKLSLVADATTSRVDVSGYDVVDISGKHVYPGFIMLNSRLGLEEVSSVDMSRDYAERGSVNPNVRTLIAYNTDSEVIPTFRFNGILMAQVVPSSGLVAGSSSVVQLDAWNWEDAAYLEDDGLHITWPRRQLPPRWWEGETDWRKNENYGSSIEVLDNLLKDAKSYAALSSRKASNLKLEAVVGLFNGSKGLYINTNNEKSIIESVTFAKKHGIKRVTLVGATGALNVSDFLAENDVSVILRPTHTQPRYPEGNYDEPYALPAQLMKKGVTVALSHSGMLARGRNLPFYAGTAAAFGASQEEALQMISSNPAKILGLDERLGTIEEGKDATLFVCEGDALDMRTNKLIHAFIGGREIQLDARQQWLYKKYADKYGH